MGLDISTFSKVVGNYLGPAEQFTDEIAIYRGQAATGGFSATPDLLLNLPIGSSVRANGLVVTDLNGDGLPDIAVAGFGTSQVSVFLNNR